MDPPIPSGVVSMRQLVDVDGNLCTFGWWLFMADADLGDFTYWSDLSTSFQFTVSGPLLACMHAGASLLACRFVVGGIGPTSYQFPWAPNHGLSTGGQAQAVACGLYIRSSDDRRGSGTRVRLPAVPDEFVDNDVALSSIGRGRLTDLGDRLTSWVSSVSGPGGGTVLLGTLQRRRAGLPLPTAVFAPAISVEPMLRIARMGRRMPRFGRYSPQ